MTTVGQLPGPEVSSAEARSSMVGGTRGQGKDAGEGDAFGDVLAEVEGAPSATGAPPRGRAQAGDAPSKVAKPLFGNRGRSRDETGAVDGAKKDKARKSAADPDGVAVYGEPPQAFATDDMAIEFVNDPVVAATFAVVPDNGATKNGHDKSSSLTPTRILVTARETHFAPVVPATVQDDSLPDLLSTAGDVSNQEEVQTPPAPPRVAPDQVDLIVALVETERPHPQRSILQVPPDDAAEMERREERPRIEIGPTHLRSSPRADRDRTAGDSPHQQMDDDRSLVAAAPGGSTATPAGAGLPPSMLQTIAAAISDAAVASAPPSVVTASEDASIVGPVKVLAIKLDLADLGHLDVRIALTGRAIALNLRAEHEGTAAKLRRDHDTLADALRTAGYDPTIRAIDRTPSDGGASARLGTSGQDQGFAGSPGGANAGQPGPGAERRSPSPSPRSDTGGDFSPLSQGNAAHDTTTADRRSRGLYV